MISVVAPIYNEEALVPLFYRAVAAELRKTGSDWEIVFVNDGSTDRSLELLTDVQAADHHVVVVDLSRNWGHMGAVTAGLRTARGQAVILMDGDFQDPPEVIPELVDSWKNGAQVVVAARRSRKESRKYLAILFPLFYKLFSFISDYPIPLNAGIFGLMDRQAVDTLNRMEEYDRYLPGLRAWMGYQTAVVYYDRNDRAAGEGKLTFLSRIKYAMDAVTGFSYKPLRLCFLLSCLCSCFTLAAVIAALVIGGGLGSVGFGVAAAVFLAGTFILLGLGILGEYIGRVYDQVRGRPLSIINRIYRSKRDLSSASEPPVEYSVDHHGSSVPSRVA